MTTSKPGFDPQVGKPTVAPVRSRSHFTQLALGALVLGGLARCAAPGEGGAGEATADLAGRVALPGRIEAEDYKTSGEGVGYHDSTPGNAGRVYRTDDVDLEASSDAGGGYNVGWIAAGEWLAYDVSVAQAGVFAFRLRVASKQAGTKQMHLEIDGQRVGSASFDDASGWQSWRDVTIGNVSLQAGNHTVRFVADSAQFNLGYLDATLTRPLCTVSSKLVPSCGMWFGSTGNWRVGTPAESIASLESAIGRKLDIVHTYHEGNQVFPTPTEQTWSDQGRILLLNWKPSTAANGWRVAASGSIDAGTIGPVADRLKAFGRPVFVALFHEPENDLPGMGTPADYVAMWRHVRQVFDAHRVTNVVWVWNMMGDYGSASHYLSGDFYPGDSYVDWIAADNGYNRYENSRWRSFEWATNNTFGASWSGFYDWETGTHPNKPFMLAEWGCVRDPADANRRGQWFREALGYLKTTRSAFRAVVYFNTVGPRGDYSLDGDAPSLRGFADLAHDPLLNQPH